MSQGRRPGGLTALAVLNFVFGGFSALGFLGMAALLAFLGVASGAAAGSEDEGMQELAKVWEEVGMGLFYALLIYYGVAAFLLIASGVGYLKQNKFWGRTLGTAYGVLAIIGGLVAALETPAEAGGGFGLMTVIGLIYPVLTVALLNTTFKEDLVR